VALVWSLLLIVDPDALEKCAGDAASGLKKPELAGSDDLSSVASKRASAQSEVEVLGE
jgi:hypothetical protein